MGLYNPVFDEFKALLSDPITETNITDDQLSKTSSFCTVAVAIYRNEKERRKSMADLIDNLLYAPVTGILARNNANSDGTIVTIAYGMSLYRAILEWKNDMGEGGCDAVKQGCFSFRNYWIQSSVRNAVLCSSAPPTHMLLIGRARSKYV